MIKNKQDTDARTVLQECRNPLEWMDWLLHGNWLRSFSEALPEQMAGS